VQARWDGRRHARGSGGEESTPGRSRPQRRQTYSGGRLHCPGEVAPHAVRRNDASPRASLWLSDTHKHTHTHKERCGAACTTGARGRAGVRLTPELLLPLHARPVARSAARSLRTITIHMEGKRQKNQRTCEFARGLHGQRPSKSVKFEALCDGLVVEGRGRGWRPRSPRQSRRRCYRRRCGRPTSARRRSTPRFCRPERARRPVLAARTHPSCACAQGIKETRTTVQAASAVASEAASFYPVPPELEHANEVPLLYNSTVLEVACVSVSRGFRL
jgi:hypothetical protein